jgi:hypothetical protein
MPENNQTITTQTTTTKAPIVLEPSDQLQFMKDTADQKKLFMELGLAAPTSLSQEDGKTWDAYLKVLYYGFGIGVIDKTDIMQYVKTFEGIPNENKIDFKTAIYNLIQEKAQLKTSVENVLDIQEINNDVEEIAQRLDEETRKKFYYYMNTGEEMPEGFEEQVQEQLQAQRELEAYERLQGVLSDKNTLNIGARTVSEPRPAGQGMTSEELAARFGLEQGAVNEYEIDPETGKYMTPEEFAILKKQREDAATAQKPQTIYQQVQQARARQAAPQPTKPVAAKTAGTLETLLK